MASRGDVISDMHLSISGSTTTTMTVTSGEEWMINMFGDDGGNIQMRHAKSGVDSGIYCGMNAGETSMSNAAISATVQMWSTQSQLPLNNDFPLKLKNVSGSTAHMMFSGTCMNGNATTSRGEVISDTDLTCSTGDQIDIRPTSGIEWLIMQASGDEGEVTAAMWRFYDRSDQIQFWLKAGRTNISGYSTYSTLHMANRARFHISNSEYIRIRNECGTTSHPVIWGIRTK